MITRDVAAKEQVIRFGFDFFKFAGSTTGTAETGFNDLTFKVSPLEGTNEITGAEDEATTAYNEQLGLMVMASLKIFLMGIIYLKK